jgi:hypothetical protein
MVSKDSGLLVLVGSKLQQVYLGRGEIKWALSKNFFHYTKLPAGGQFHNGNLIPRFIFVFTEIDLFLTEQA